MSAASGPDERWQRLDPRTAVASGVWALGAGVAGGVPTVAGFATHGSSATGVATVIVIAAVVVLVVGAVVAERVRLARTRFRIGPGRVELHTGILVRSRRSLPRERVRAVDVHADPVARVLGLATLRVGTGRRAAAGDRRLELRAVRRDEAEALRSLLLAGRGRDDDAGLLAELDPAWIRYAPLSFLTVALGAAAAGVVMQVAQWVGLENAVVDGVIAGARSLGLVVFVLVGLGVVLVVGSVVSVGAFVEAWWHYRLERESSRTVRVRRGLLTTRSTSLEERRLHGVALVEPLGVRAAGAARVDAIATGLSSPGSGDEQRCDPSGLLPAAPRAVAERVAAAVLREPESPTRAELRAHPVAARTRRVRWATAAGLVPAVALAVLGLVPAASFGVAALLVAVAVAVVAVIVGRAVGRGAYAALGHAVHGPYVVIRAGRLRRRTVVLRRDGIIGWHVRRSWAQRRVDLATVWFTTAAGDQAYPIRDLAARDAAAFAREVLGRDLLSEGRAVWPAAM